MFWSNVFYILFIFESLYFKVTETVKTAFKMSFTFHFKFILCIFSFFPAINGYIKHFIIQDFLCRNFIFSYLIIDYEKENQPNIYLLFSAWAINVQFYFKVLREFLLNVRTVFAWNIALNLQQWNFRCRYYAGKEYIKP